MFVLKADSERAELLQEEKQKHLLQKSHIAERRRNNPVAMAVRVAIGSLLAVESGC